MEEGLCFIPPKKICGVRNAGSIPGLGRSPGEGNDNPLQYSCLENPMDRGAWEGTVHGVAKSWTRLKRLSTHTLATQVPSNKPHHGHTSSLSVGLQRLSDKLHAVPGCCLHQTGYGGWWSESCPKIPWTQKRSSLTDVKQERREALSQGMTLIPVSQCENTEQQSREKAGTDSLPHWVPYPYCGPGRWRYRRKNFCQTSGRRGWSEGVRRACWAQR